MADAALATTPANLPAPLAPAAGPAPEPATIAAVRAALGRRRPPGADRTADPVDRLDLLGAALAPETAALAVLWLASTRRGATNTRATYADDLLHWSGWYAQARGDRLDLTRLTRADVTLWLATQQAAGRAPSTIARRLAALSSLYRYGAGHGLPLVSPVTEDHRPQVDRDRSDNSARVLTDDEVTSLYRACSDQRDALVLALLDTDGLRVSEVCAADDDDVITTGRRSMLRIRRKGGRVARVALDPAVCDLLDAYRQERPPHAGAGPAPLLVDHAGARLDRHDVARMLHRIARAAGIRDHTGVTPHAVRASAITGLADRKVPITEIRAWAGQRDVATTMRYVERHQADERNAGMTATLAVHLVHLPRWVRRGPE